MQKNCLLYTRFFSTQQLVTIKKGLLLKKTDPSCKPDIIFYYIFRCYGNLQFPKYHLSSYKILYNSCTPLITRPRGKDSWQERYISCPPLITRLHGKCRPEWYISCTHIITRLRGKRQAGSVCRVLVFPAAVNLFPGKFRRDKTVKNIGVKMRSRLFQFLFAPDRPRGAFASEKPAPEPP